MFRATNSSKSFEAFFDRSSAHNQLYGTIGTIPVVGESIVVQDLTNGQQATFEVLPLQNPYCPGFTPVQMIRAIIRSMIKGTISDPEKIAGWTQETL